MKRRSSTRRLALLADRSVLDAEIHRQFAEACHGLKDDKRAIEEYETALELKPKDVNLQLALAETYLAVERRDDARKLVEDVLKEDKEDERRDPPPRRCSGDE